ncbi:major facilitator superfamily domain-containing protein [Microdochium trichocladiopsis]|uniref:Major facilitator superfamily domain-containing protein n=1 Tax=Microdochium trichocladiopsis TaxID=1682393 RepID=A0A9P9BIR1_9PEZI|nr:major facilitator superfamily domain-containing protein [Microdochium trichocladiopsis]KAH7012548.1 major facilitator superfamily domain-containing protein [Microdochium trichocladiopsis]
MYQTAISIFSASYIFMQLPSTILMSKLQPHIFLPSCIVTWAIISGCTGATTNAAGLLVVRFCLGIVEAPFFPGSIYFLSCWYTKKELGVRMALLVSGLLLSNAFAGLISAGLLSGMNGVGGLAAWRWLFIIEGHATVVLGVVCFFVLPDYPGTTSWLSETEKVVAQARLVADAGTEDEGVLSEDTTTIWQGLSWAVQDYRTWLFACLQVATTASISFSNFFPTVLQQLGIKSSTTVLLLTAPPYLFTFTWAVSFAFDADKRQKRSPHAIISGLVAMAGTVCTVALPAEQRWPKYALTFVICAGRFGIYSKTYTWLSSTIVQPRIKRACAIGVANTCANTAALFSSYFWIDKFQPQFKQSWACVLGFQCLGMACILGLRYTLKRKNRQFDELDQRNLGVAGIEAEGRVLSADEKRAVNTGFRFIT